MRTSLHKRSRFAQRPKKKSADGDAAAKAGADDDAVFGTAMTAAFDAAGVSAFVAQAAQRMRVQLRDGVRQIERNRPTARKVAAALR